VKVIINTWVINRKEFEMSEMSAVNDAMLRVDEHLGGTANIAIILSMQKAINACTSLEEYQNLCSEVASL